VQSSERDQKGGGGSHPGRETRLNEPFRNAEAAKEVTERQGQNMKDMEEERGYYNQMGKKRAAGS